MKAGILTVRKGDIVRFVKYALRVEQEPPRGTGFDHPSRSHQHRWLALGHQTFLGGRVVEIERGAK
jgi:hypothetical protein